MQKLTLEDHKFLPRLKDGRGRNWIFQIVLRTCSSVYAGACIYVCWKTQSGVYFLKTTIYLAETV
jgi:hypothetical protein